MFTRILAITVGLCLAIGCIHVPPQVQQPVAHATAPFERYISPNYDWQSVKRIVILPFANQVSGTYPHVSDEMRVSLATELQRVGRFEIAVAPIEDRAVRAQDIFMGGQFNELEMLRVARAYQADAVMLGNVTQYNPYIPPRVGLSLVIISPTEGMAIASVEGMWDAREKTTADQIHAYYLKTQHFVSSLRGSDRVTDLPADFQRFVCQQVALGLVPNSTGGLLPPGSTPGDPMCPPGPAPGTTIPVGGMPIGGAAPAAAVPENGFMPPLNSAPIRPPMLNNSMPSGTEFVPPVPRQTNGS